MKFEVKKITQDIILKHNTLKEHPSCNNMEVITVYDDNSIELGYAILTPQKNYNLDEVFQKNFIGLKEYSKIEYNELYSRFKNILNKCSYLNFMKVHEQNKGTGKILLNHLKKIYKNIWLYSVIDSEYFWENNSFEEIGNGDHNFLYSIENK